MISFICLVRLRASTWRAKLLAKKRGDIRLRGPSLTNSTSTVYEQLQHKCMEQSFHWNTKKRFGEEGYHYRTTLDKSGNFYYHEVVSLSKYHGEIHNKSYHIHLPCIIFDIKLFFPFILSWYESLFE